MTDAFYKFPSTPHLALLGNLDVRGDKVLTGAERAAFLQHPVVVEEKIDGANLGISIDESGEIRAQNRGSYLDLQAPGQWKKLGEWLKPRVDRLFDVLGVRYILFGEWCYAQHSIYYSRLPDWFLAYDVYDKVEERFFSCARRDQFLKALDVACVPVIGTGRFSLADLKAKLGPSAFSDQPAEGLYIRRDEGDWLAQRAKLVRPDFVQAMDVHWSKGGIQPNRVSWGGGVESWQ